MFSDVTKGRKDVSNLNGSQTRNDNLSMTCNFSIQLEKPLRISNSFKSKHVFKIINESLKLND